MQKLHHLSLLFFVNSALAQSAPIFEPPVRIQAEGKPLSISGGYTFPTTIDLDKDGLEDLLVGEYSKGGEIYFYKNTGTKEEPKYGEAKNLMIGKEVLKVPGVGT